uniref:Uncharacterized protein n=1 Tax=Parastrongyloides trichosuri TaxID=131310 RepID=A0A0N4ZRZ3_PARTI
MVSTRRSKKHANNNLGIKNKSISKKNSKKEEVAMEIDGEVVKTTKEDAKKLVKERKQHQRWKGNEEHPDIPEPKSETTRRNPKRIGRCDLKSVPTEKSSIVPTVTGNSLVIGHRMTKKAMKKIEKMKKKELKEKEEKKNKMEC